MPIPIWTDSFLKAVRVNTPRKGTDISDGSFAAINFQKHPEAQADKWPLFQTFAREAARTRTPTSFGYLHMTDQLTREEYIPLDVAHY